MVLLPKQPNTKTITLPLEKQTLCNYSFEPAFSWFLSSHLSILTSESFLQIYVYFFYDVEWYEPKIQWNNIQYIP